MFCYILSRNRSPTKTAVDDAWIPRREKLAMVDRQPHDSFLVARYDFRQTKARGG
ncbi:MAG: hypothetical protein GY696_08650 [Gammaproteobacteria bacterium]|nr:hypothetical protein [Gammaproteobacteria bacterium]